MRIRPSLEMNGRSRSSVPMSRNSTLCVELVSVTVVLDVALLFADLDFGPLLVQHHQPRRGDDVGVADRFQGVEERAQAAVEEAELQRRRSS